MADFYKFGTMNLLCGTQSWKKRKIRNLLAQAEALHRSFYPPPNLLLCFHYFKIISITSFHVTQILKFEVFAPSKFWLFVNLNILQIHSRIYFHDWAASTNLAEILIMYKCCPYGKWIPFANWTRNSSITTKTK